MIKSAQHIAHGARTWGQLLAAGCTESITADEVFRVVTRHLPDDPVLVRQVLTGCVAISAEINLQLFRQPRPPMGDELASPLNNLSPDLSTARDIKSAASLMQLWSVAYTDGDPAALRRFVPIVDCRTTDLRRRTLVAMMVLHLHNEVAQLTPFGRETLSATLNVAPVRADARAHILATLWAEGAIVGNLRFQQVLISRLKSLRQRVHADVLWVCARTIAAGLMPGEPLDESAYGCECHDGQQAASWLANAINAIAKGTPHMQAFLRVQYGLRAAREPQMADHLLSVGVAWLARRFATS